MWLIRIHSKQFQFEETPVKPDSPFNLAFDRTNLIANQHSKVKHTEVEIAAKVSPANRNPLKMSAPELPPLQDNELPTNAAALEAEIKQMNSDIRKCLEKMNTKDDKAL